jgi:methylmalonyl-CoA/ethylmalonyl-CoA epimerase
MDFHSFTLIHIGWITRNLEEARRGFEILGIGPFRVLQPEYQEKSYMGQKGDFEMKFALAPLGPIEIELIEPLAGKSVYNDFLEKTGGGFHHLAYEVPDLAEALRMLGNLGLKEVMSGARKGLRFAYLQGESGPIFELLERK